MTESLIVVDELSKTYEPSPRWMRMLVRSSTDVSVTALDDVSFEVEAGQICAVIGPNGAGKSTLFRILTGLTTPTTGRVSVLGMDPATEAHRIRRLVGFMPAEDRTLFLRHTCRENLRFHGRLQGLDKDKMPGQIDDVLDLVGLAEARDRTGFALSSGMRARLMLARALLHEPRVLILDEPTGAIDPLGAHEFLKLIVRLTRSRGTATLVSSHRLEEIEALRDNILLLDRGRVAFWGNLDHIKHLADLKTFEIECLNEESAAAVANHLRHVVSRSVPEIVGSVVLFPAEAVDRRNLTWLSEVGAHVQAVSLRKRSLRETISSLLNEAGRS